MFNAGEIRLTGETSLGIVNNHVGRLTQFMNNKHLTHSEVLAVKQAFVNALSREGKLDSNAINEVRRDLGLAPQENGSVADLHSRSIKPLSRQQVRQILDRYADTINDSLEATEGRIVVKSEELYGNVEENERATNERRRDEVNESLATRRILSVRDTIEANADQLVVKRDGAQPKIEDSFQSPEVKAAALGMGFTEAELSKIARATAWPFPA